MICDDTNEVAALGVLASKLMNTLDDTLGGIVTMVEATPRAAAWRARFVQQEGFEPGRSNLMLWLIGEGIGATLLRANEPLPEAGDVEKLLATLPRDNVIALAIRAVTGRVTASLLDVV
jgi:hypothetical protein